MKKPRKYSKVNIGKSESKERESLLKAKIGSVDQESISHMGM